MDIKKMIDITDKTEVDPELLVSKVNRNLINLYNKKDIGDYTEILRDMLMLAVQLKFDLVLKYFGAVPIVAADERNQFQEIFKCLGTRSSNKDWYLNLFSLFLGMAFILRFDMSEIEKNFFEKTGT
ncbi:hypothetical protein P4534_24925 [Peribacillus butanolivorans]|uniref:hypothetical protein n=1 Tax=Peribacillus butanolivorans TaxID=421767 RepID=UPI002E24D512|nr:hypothetical protein [Peribacillus butanolivorans]